MKALPHSASNMCHLCTVPRRGAHPDHSACVCLLARCGTFFPLPALDMWHLKKGLGSSPRVPPAGWLPGEGSSRPPTRGLGLLAALLVAARSGPLLHARLDMPCSAALLAHPLGPLPLICCPFRFENCKGGRASKRQAAQRLSESPSNARRSKDSRSHPRCLQGIRALPSAALSPVLWFCFTIVSETWADPFPAVIAQGL